ncbi:MAG: TonB-dependent receptor, partial [Pseudomonadota bacterium]
MKPTAIPTFVPKCHPLFCSLICLQLISFTLLAQTTSEETANEDIEVITVVAERVERTLQDISSSITVVSAEDLKLVGGKTLIDAAALAPNVIVQNQGGRTGTYFYTRGIGRSELNFPIVSVNVNGVALPDPSFFGLDLDAAESVEFLRGPQGTLYGQNTLGGVINIQLKKPDELFAGDIDIQFAERSHQEASVRLSGPITQNTFLSGSLLHRDVEGYIFNPTTNSTQNDEQTLGGSLYLISQLTSNLSLEVNYFTQSRDDGLPQFAQRSNPFEITNNAPTQEETDSNIYGIKLEYDFDSFSLISQTGFSDISRFTENDLDFSPISAAFATAQSDIEQWSQEFRIAGGTKNLSYQAGLYASGLDNDFDVFIFDEAAQFGFGIPAVINDLIAFSDKTKAVFGQINWQQNRLELIFGLRYQSQDLETDNLNSLSAFVNGIGSPPLVPPTMLSAEDSVDEWLPRLSINYSVQDDLNLYGTISKGMRPGGFNDTALSAELLGINLPTSFGPEFTTNYEVGVKWRLPNQFGRVDAAMYYIDWSDLQTEQIAPGTLFDFRTNAASATSKGIEVEMRLFPHPFIEIGLSGGYANAEYDEFV